MKSFTGANTPNGPLTECTLKTTSKRSQHQTELPTKPKNALGHIVIPYTQGLCESIRNISNKHGIQTHFKSGRTLKNVLVISKDKVNINHKSGFMYWDKCNRVECDEECIRELARTF